MFPLYCGNYLAIWIRNRGPRIRRKFMGWMEIVTEVQSTTSPSGNHWWMPVYLHGTLSEMARGLLRAMSFQELCEARKPSVGRLFPW
jgi:hypothetical protein